MTHSEDYKKGYQAGFQAGRRLVKPTKAVMPTIIVARHKRTGSEYVFAEKTEHGNFYRVYTKAAKSPSPYLVDAGDIELL